MQIHRVCVQHGLREAQPPPLQAPGDQSPQHEPGALLQQAAQRLSAFLRRPHRGDQDIHHGAGVREDEVGPGRLCSYISQIQMNICMVSVTLCFIPVQRAQGPGGEGSFPSRSERPRRRRYFRLPYEVDHRRASAGQGEPHMLRLRLFGIFEQNGKRFNNRLVAVRLFKTLEAIGRNSFAFLF